MKMDMKRRGNKWSERKELCERTVSVVKSVFDVLYKIANLRILVDHKMKVEFQFVQELIEVAEKKPNVIVGIIVSLAAVIVSPLLKILTSN
ncbi:hypothetical protein L1987_09112 [Smallanthus sonchifolius]|uniref:Uncharacterized protein n=1 Tax=Smallanthus sonchifolius TaxID=185202 RepID=A0ACB9JM25_9ASTR|nr:hypothetical protein L1987_09112 [Smallanthus sonchifolius]